MVFLKIRLRKKKLDKLKTNICIGDILMPIEIVTLATTLVTSFLLPYLQKGADDFLSEIASKSGKGIAKHTLEVTEKIWKRVKSVFSSEADKVTLGYFEKNPEKFKDEMQESLSTKLKSNQELALYLSDLAYSKPQGSGQTAAQIVTTTINVTVEGNSFRNIDNVNIIGKQTRE